MQFLNSYILLLTPVLLASLAILWTEKSGVLNIGLEGNIVFSGYMTLVSYHMTESYLISMLAGSLSGLFIALIQSILILNLGLDQVVVTTSNNLIAYGLTSIFMQNHENGSFLFSIGLSDNDGLWFYYFFILLLVSFLTYYSMCKHHRYSEILVRAGDQFPDSYDVKKTYMNTRYISMLICGLLSGLVGSFQILVIKKSFSILIGGGLGFLAIALVSFSNWKYIQLLLTCILFIGVKAVLSLYLEDTIIIEILSILSMLFLGSIRLRRSGMPKILGMNYS